MVGAPHEYAAGPADESLDGVGIAAGAWPAVSAPSTLPIAHARTNGRRRMRTSLDGSRESKRSRNLPVLGSTALAAGLDCSEHDRVSGPAAVRPLNGHYLPGGATPRYIFIPMLSLPSMLRFPSWHACSKSWNSGSLFRSRAETIVQGRV